MKRSSIIRCVAAATLIVGGSHPAHGNDLSDPTNVNVALLWNDAAVTAIKSTSTPPTVAARALAIVHSAMYDAWAAYDPKAVGSLPGSPPRQSASAMTTANKSWAVSYAAYDTLVDLYPTQAGVFKALLITLGFDPTANTTSFATPAGVGNVAAANQLKFRHSDGSNQLGDLGGPYSDYTGYQPVNFPETIVDPNHWQPLRLANGTVQQFLSPFWGKVIPFALQSSSQFRPGPQPQAETWLYQQRMRDDMRLNAELDDRSIMSAEYWDDAAGTETPPGHWNRLAEEISNRDQHGLDDDVKMFFALNNALLDTSIAVWEAKRTYDAIRPVSAIHYYYQGQMIQGWGGPGKGTTTIDGASWTPWITMPPHPEYPSGHSAFSSGCAEILRRFTGSDTYVKTVPFTAGSSRYDPGHSPAADGQLSWLTFSEIADDAGFSRRLGGIHYEEADYRSRIIGRQVAGVVWDRYQLLLNGGTQ